MHTSTCQPLHFLTSIFLSIQVLYDSTNGPTWKNNTYWDFSDPNVDPCSPLWYGLTCTSDGNAIKGLYLSNNNLQGTLSNEMFGVFNQSLVHLSLAANILHGTLPDTVYGLTELGHLNVSRNSFTGTIPNNIGNMQQLRNLSMFHNMLDGTLTDRIGDLRDITYIALYNNSITGEIPSSIGNLDQLNFLSIRDNPIHGMVTQPLFCNIL